MNSLYSNPIRVYIILGAIALFGIYSGLNLPISLFPNSSKPTIFVSIGYGSSNAEEFVNTYGRSFESRLRNIKTDSVETEKLEAEYESSRARYTIDFGWGSDPDAALKEVDSVTNSFTARLPQESRDSLRIGMDRDNTGFFAMSFYSESRDLNELYDILDPILDPKLSQIEEAEDTSLWNPVEEQVQIQLNPEAMAAVGLFPRHIHAAIESNISGAQAGSVTVGLDQLQIQMPRQAKTVQQLGQIPVATPSGRLLHLSDLAHISVGPKSDQSRRFKTSGTTSLILFAVPKPGGNIKKMSESIIAAVDEAKPQFPPDVQSKILVDPSEFIRSSISNVAVEVGLAALLAVLVLFVFIGSFRNVATAAIEIPMSIVLAFIMMRLTGMNINLISLGGLALSAGMNVDASVVVMENIFRHFEMNPGRHSFSQRLAIVVGAVKEVRFAIIAATISSLVVFLPLTFTSDLAYSILGDLAKAVVFSHGFSAFVALLLVPTIRLQLMGRGDIELPKSPIDGTLKKLEAGYSRLLGHLIDFTHSRLALYGTATVVLILLVLVVLPRLPREVIGNPDTDWMMLGMNTDGNTKIQQMEAEAERVENEFLAKFGNEIRYTFNMIQSPNQAILMGRLKDKSKTKVIWKQMEAAFSSTPLLNFWVAPWNPSELPIPNPPNLKISIRGGDIRDRALVAHSIDRLLEENKVYPDVWTEPNSNRREGIFLTPHNEQWEALQQQSINILPRDLADVLRVATTGRPVGYFPRQNRLVDISMIYPPDRVDTVESIAAFPIGLGDKIVPLKALATVEVKQTDPTLLREDERELFSVEGRNKRSETQLTSDDNIQARDLVKKWRTSEMGQYANEKGILVAFEKPDKEITDAISQLGTAVALSIALIFLTLLLQFGTLMEPLLILVSVPLGFIGVLASLYLFGTTLSLNAILGVILLNGIAVANSIILVDFIKRLVAGGLAPREAALQAARKRLRPILITSLTTILGMLPIAIGMGEGGHILQPLGIAVCGGLWVSTLLTLFVVPSLHVMYLQWQQSSSFSLRQWIGNRLGMGAESAT